MNITGMRQRVDLRKNRQSWPIRVLAARMMWLYLGRPIFALCPPRLFRLKSMILRVFGAKIGKKVLIGWGVKVLMPWNLIVDDYVAFGSGVDIYNFAVIKIGSMVVISQRVFLCTGTHDHSDPSYPLRFYPILIESDVWIAAEAFIGPGVSVGQGAVIGARSVVTRDLKGWNVYAGNPARALKAREIRGE